MKSRATFFVVFSVVLLAVLPWSVPFDARLLLSLVIPGLAVWLFGGNRGDRKSRRTNKRTAPSSDNLSSSTFRQKSPHRASFKPMQEPSSERPHSVYKRPTPPSDYRPPKQDYAAIIRAVRRSNAPQGQTHVDRKQAGPMTRHQGWVHAGETVSVGGRDLGGMIYVGTPPSLNTYGYRDVCRAYIDPSLPVSPYGSDRDGFNLPYWPGYSAIPPNCRGTYLDWLATGRSDPAYDPGYMFLYFYGLERRFFLDAPPKSEQAELLEEVRRLALLYPENRSVQRYLGEFIEVAEVAVFGCENITPSHDNPGWELPFSLKMGLGAKIETGSPLNSDWILSWLVCHPEYGLRTPAKRCSEEFRALFRLRFGERYPDGYKVTKPRKSLDARYRAASGEFDVKLVTTLDGKPLPDVSNLRKPLDIAKDLAERAMDDLDKYSRYLGREPDGRGSLEAHALLPAELRPLFPSSEVEALGLWAGEIAAAGGLVPIADVVERLQGRRPEKISKRVLTSAADALARLGFGLAPDPRYALRSPKLDEPAVIFEFGGPIESLEDVSPRYRSALMELAVATFVAHADGRVVELERQSLADQVLSVEGVKDEERARLQANLDWFLAVPPDLSLLRRRLKDMDEEHHAALRASVVSAAYADGIVVSEEVSGIEKIYKALGLDPALAYSDLHAGNIDDRPKTVKAARPALPGEQIPTVNEMRGAALDASRIAEIRSDTERVSTVLGNIFSDDENDEDAATSHSPSALAGLDVKHSELIRDLVQKTHWSDEGFQQLCERRDLLVAGALEAVNEWAFEAHGEALLDEYDGYDVAPDVAQAVKAVFREAQHAETETA